MLNLINMFAEARVEFVLTGDLAAGLHGYQKPLTSMEMAVAMDDANVQRFLSVAHFFGLRPTLPVELDTLAQSDMIEQRYRENEMRVFGLRGPTAAETIINVLVKPIIPYVDLRRDAVMIDVGPIFVPVASIEHLIAMKTNIDTVKV